MDVVTLSSDIPDTSGYGTGSLFYPLRDVMHCIPDRAHMELSTLQEREKNAANLRQKQPYGLRTFQWFFNNAEYPVVGYIDGTSNSTTREQFENNSWGTTYI